MAMDNGIWEKLQEPEITGKKFSTDVNFAEYPEADFTNKTLTNVDFSGNETIKGISFHKATLIDCNFENARIDKCSFKNATITDCNFENTTIDNCDFSSAKIKGTGEDKLTSFKHAQIAKTSFKEATISKTKFSHAKCFGGDFRYAKITNSSFKNVQFELSDFYQTAFKGITVFQDSQFRLCSLSCISFDDYCIMRENLKKSPNNAVLVQEDETIYKVFLKSIAEEKSTDQSVGDRYREATQIYRQFTALWEGKGLNEDGNWAYVQSKRMERKRLMLDSTKEKKVSNRCKAALNWLNSSLLGYGVRMANVAIAFALVIAIFTVVYSIWDGGFPKGLLTSIGYIIGIGDREKLPPDTPLYVLSMVQTAIGIFLLGVFGFMVSNKIRKS